MWKRAFVFSRFPLLSEATSWNFTPPAAEQQKRCGTARKAGLKAEKIGQNLKKKKGLIHPTSQLPHVAAVMAGKSRAVLGLKLLLTPGKSHL